MVTQLVKHFRHCLLFLYDKNNDISSRKASAELKAVYGEEAPSQTTCSRWLNRFRSGDKSLDDLDDEPRSGRPTTFDEERLRTLVEEDPRLTVRKIAEILDCSIGSVHDHLHAIGKVSKLGKWVPHLLSQRNKDSRVQIAQELLNRYRQGSLHLDDIITSDEKWVLYVNVVRRRSWVNAGEPGLPTAMPGTFIINIVDINHYCLHTGLHPRKILLSVWWDTEGVVWWELLPAGVTITAEVYCEQLS